MEKTARRPGLKSFPERRLAEGWLARAGDLLYPASVKQAGEITCALLRLPREGSREGPPVTRGKALGLFAPREAALEGSGFEGERADLGGKAVLIGPLSHANAEALRRALPFTAPSPLADRNATFGLGDRLGLAGPGHLRAVRRFRLSPVLAQQSVRRRPPEDRGLGAAGPGHRLHDDHRRCVGAHPGRTLRRGRGAAEAGLRRLARGLSPLEPALYRRLHAAALERFAAARQYYQVSTNLGNVPPLDGLADAELPGLFDNPDARQLLHITYGELLRDPQINQACFAGLDRHLEEYWKALEAHLGRHFQTLGLASR